jgi:sugar lactone lactonase YvrE
VSRVEVALDGRAALAEGPIWDARSGTLLWVDILAGELHRFDPDAGADHLVAAFDAPVAGAAVRQGSGLVCAVGMELALLDEADGTLRPIATATAGDRLNEVKCDPGGRLWAGTLTADHRPGASALYRLDGEGRLDTVLDDVALSNGIGWSPDATTMYYVDTPREIVDAFDYDAATGVVSGRRTFVDLHDVPGRPDGLTVDAEGGVWVAMARGWAVRRFGPDGALERVIDVPAFRVTSCTFGGAELTDLYITTARFDLDDAALADQPHAGAIFRCTPGVHGLPAAEYAG